jgi:outer membrane protein W
MNLIKKLLFAAGFISATTAQAQTVPGFKDFGAFSWEISVPSGDKFLNETSLSGWRFEYRRMVSANISVGLGISWNAFDEYFNTETFASKDGRTAVTSDRIRQVYTVPITATAHYYFGAKNKMITPYAGVGIGTQFAEMNSYFNIYQLTEDNWAFVVRPEVGVLVRLGASPTYALLSVGYNYATNKNEAYNITNVSQISFNIGIGVGN